MACRIEAEKLQSLTCPMCLDVFTNATLLTCGHTFCRECLKDYDEQHQELDHIICPVCRERSHLGADRVAGLTPNFSIKGLESELQLEDQVDPVAEIDKSSDRGELQKGSPEYCDLHSRILKDIFCRQCGEFLCLNCYVGGHAGHKVVKWEELGDELRKQEELLKKLRTRKAHVDGYLQDAKVKKETVLKHLANLEKEIRDVCIEKIDLLKKDEQELLTKVENLRKDANVELESCIVGYLKSMEKIEQSMARLNNSISGTDEGVGSFQTKYKNLEEPLEDIVQEFSLDVTQTAESAKFCPADKKLLAVGRLELGEGDAVDAIEHPEAVDDVGATEDRAPSPSSNMYLRMYPEMAVGQSEFGIGQSELKVVRKIDLPSIMRGMSAMYHDSVVVGYGERKHGSDSFSLLHDRKQHLASDVGKVYDIAFLPAPDRRMVVSQGMSCRIYDSQSPPNVCFSYACPVGGYPALSTDQYDNIYAVNGNPEIYIFLGNNRNPHKIIPTGDVKPRQICVTKTGAMITTTCDVTPSRLTVFDRDGRVGSTIVANDDDEYLYAAVDSIDRIIVGTVRRESDVLRVARYSLIGKALIPQMTFKDFRLPHGIATLCSYCYLASVAPNMIAMANHTKLYFLELPLEQPLYFQFKGNHP